MIDLRNYADLRLDHIAHIQYISIQNDCFESSPDGETIVSALVDSRELEITIKSAARVQFTVLDLVRMWVARCCLQRIKETGEFNDRYAKMYIPLDKDRFIPTTEFTVAAFTKIGGVDCTLVVYCDELWLELRPAGLSWGVVHIVLASENLFAAFSEALKENEKLRNLVNELTTTIDHGHESSQD